MPVDAIFVTGGSGFIGSAVLRCLQEAGEPCVVLDCAPPAESGCEFRQVDITSLDACLEGLEGARKVVHLAGLVAGPANANPYLATSVNVGGAANVFEACRLHGVQRLVYASTFFVFEDCGLDEVDELARLDISLMGPFARSKFICEQLARDYHKKHNLSAAGLRFGSVYGPGKGSNVVNDFIEQAIRGEEIVVWGEGKRHRQFIYVNDIAESVKAALASSACGAFNIAGSQQTSTREVLETIRRFLPSTKLTFDATKPEKVQPYRMALERANSELGWQPRTSIEEGIERTIAWTSKASFEAAAASDPAETPKSVATQALAR